MKPTDPPNTIAKPATTCHGCTYRRRKTGSVPGHDCAHPQQPAPCVPGLRNDCKNVRLEMAP
jgi:hypothetical protein